MSAESPVSKVNKRLWGGQLAPRREGPAAPPDPGPVAAIGAVLRRTAELALMASVLAVPLLYQFDLPDGAEVRIAQLLGEGTLFEYHVHPYIAAMMPVLESKFVAWAVCGLLMIAAFVGAQVAEHLAGTAPARVPAGEPGSAAARHRRVPLFCFLGFVVMALASIILWPPEMPAEAAATLGAAAGEGGGVKRLGGGGFLHSATAWGQVLFVFVYFLVAEDLIRTRGLVARLLGLLVFSGFVNAMVVFFQQVRLPGFTSLWVQFGEEDTRNNLGAFIGHNTGVSSYLMAPLLVCVALLLGRVPTVRRPERRLLALVALLMVYALLVAQSRAVLPITAAAVAAMIALLYRHSCLQLRARPLIWLGVAVGLLAMTQLIDSRYNPLRRADVNLAERVVNDLSPTHLRTETRLRILLVSVAELIPAAPLLGHGFASFQYVYPAAQGEWYRNNPETRIAPTPNRSFHAHNEYLQTMIELGAVGLALGIVGLVYILLGGLAILRKSLMPHHVTLQVAILMGFAAILLHALFDFPFRIAPIAHTLVLLLAIWSAGDRLWLFPLKEPPVDDERPVGMEPPAAPTPRGGAITRLALACGVALLAMGAAVGVAAATIVPFQSVATLNMRATRLLDFARTPGPERLRWLALTEQDIRAARRHSWLHGPTCRLAAQSNLLKALALPDPTGRALSARTGLRDINLALSEERFHSLYAIRSALAGILAGTALEPDERALFRETSFGDARRAAEMNPGDPNALYNYIIRLDEDRTGNRSFLLQSLRLLYRFHRPTLEKRYFAQILDQLAMGRIDIALERLRLLVEVAPGDLTFRLTMAAALTRLPGGGIEGGPRAIPLITDVISELELAQRNRPPDAPPDPLLATARLALVAAYIAEHRDREAEALLDEISASNREASAVLVSWRYLLAERAAAEASGARAAALAREVADRRAQLLDLARREPMALQFTGEAALTLFQRPDLAIEWLTARARAANDSDRTGDPVPPMDIVGTVMLAKALDQAGRRAEALALFGEYDPASQRFLALDALPGGSDYLRSLAVEYGRTLLPTEVAP